MISSFDYLLAGGGGAGLALADMMIRYLPADRTIGVIDRDRKQSNDRTWCYWHTAETEFDHLVFHRWNRMRLVGAKGELQVPLTPYQYRMIRGIDFYNDIRRKIAEHPNAHIIDGEVAHIEDGEEWGTVHTSKDRYRGKWVFNSLFDANSFRLPAGSRILLQHFVGWLIHTPKPCFDPDVATWFDFSPPQREGTTFFYILPFQERRALVEYTLFSAHRLEEAAYEKELHSYICHSIGNTDFEILERERGAIPMTDLQFTRRSGNRIMEIGTCGGMVKPSTGFAFERIRRDSKAIVDSLRAEGHPFHRQQAPARYRTFDSMLLDVIGRHPHNGARVLYRLFSCNPVTRVLRFLDERGNIWENIALMMTVSWTLFLGAYWRIRKDRWRKNWRKIFMKNKIRNVKKL